MQYVSAPDVKYDVDWLVIKLEMDHINRDRVFCIRSTQAKTRAIARIWSAGKLFFTVTALPISYIIEVIDRRYDKLPHHQRLRVLIHELLHIPLGFTGSLRSHQGPHHAVDDSTVEKLCRQYHIE